MFLGLVFLKFLLERLLLGLEAILKYFRRNLVL